MIFEWDPEKAALNEAKHAVAFPEAATAFGDPLSLTIADPDHSTGEERYILTGMAASGRLVVVSHTYRHETIRIISVRLATGRERRDYENG